MVGILEMDYKEKQLLGSIKERLRLHSQSLKALSESCERMSKELDKLSKKD